VEAEQEKMKLLLFKYLMAAGLGKAYTLGGGIADAVPLLTQALEQATPMARVHYQIRCRLFLGQAHLLAGRLEEALTLAETLGMRPLVAHCHLGLGTLYATTSQREQARATLTTAIALYRAMDMTFWLPQAEAALAQVG
jgi:Flp pilus assembly protein TadD